jgi:hypothetical protein
MTPQPLIVVHDVPATSRWYQATLGLQGGHGGLEYEMLMDGERMVMQLHHWDAHQHPHMGQPAQQPYGNGVLLWFKTDHFDEALARMGRAAPLCSRGRSSIKTRNTARCGCKIPTATR